MADVIIGIDPHKGSHTAVALDRDEHTLARLRVNATAAQVDQLRRWAKPWPQRTWAIEGARGLGRLLAQQLVAAGESVVDVQPKLAARVLLLNTGQANKNDRNDARSIAAAALRAPWLSTVAAEDDTAAMKMWGAPLPRPGQPLDPDGMPAARCALRSRPRRLRPQDLGATSDSAPGDDAVPHAW